MIGADQARSAARKGVELHVSSGYCALLAIGLIAGCATSVEDETANAEAGREKPFAIDHFDWRGDIAGSERIVATNEWGDLRVRTTRRGGMRVSAVIQKIGTAQEELEVRVERKADRVDVNVATLTADPGGRVDLTLLVPPGLSLAGRTLDGLAEIKYTGDIEAQTRGGQILIAASQTAVARSVSGGIIVRLEGTEWHGPLAFESGSGDITLSLPEDANVDLRVHTAGTIDSEFAAARRIRAARDQAGYAATLGGGGTEVTIRSDSGDVRIVARPQ